MREPSTLRDRRREQTAQDLQRAALRLALESGYDSLTTDMIATRAGISLRTFFNYYPNKDAALVGSPPDISEASKQQFLASDGPLVDDLFDVLGRMLTDKRLERDVPAMIGELLATSPELLAIFHTALERLHSDLTALALERMGPGQEADAQLLAHVLSRAITIGFRAWATDATIPRDQIVQLARQRVGRLTRLLQAAS